MTKVRPTHLLVSLLMAVVLVTAMTLPASATPPGIPDPTTARTELDALTVAPDGSMSGYSRDEFPHWITISGSCDTREEVLIRDGADVSTDSDCYPTSGSWYSLYDGETWSQASDVDIDHVVPLADAWRTGASSWTLDEREAYANDLDDPQLIAVTDNVNQSKGDQSPDQWKPPLESSWCTYAAMWVQVKYTWNLTVNSDEKAALDDMLSTC